MRYVLLVAFLIAVLALGLVWWIDRAEIPDQGDLFEHVALSRLADPYWSQGEAEVNLYRATLVKYGRPRQTDDVAHILVTEDHDPGLLVKANDWRRPGLLPVLKFNALVQVQTGVYPYRQMLSVFIDRRRGRFAKMTFSSQEWCGTSFKELVHFGGKGRFHFNTYWDGEGNASRPVDLPGDAVPYDSLPAQLRILVFEPGLSVTFPLVSSQFSSRAEEPSLDLVRLAVQEMERIEVPLGIFPAVRLKLESAAGTDLLWFESEFPHRMLKWETRDGNRFELRESRKTAYWTQNRPEDEPFYQW